MSAYAQNSTAVYGARTVADATSEVRMAFIRKVYLCLSAMLLTAIGAAAVSIKMGWAVWMMQQGIWPMFAIFAFGFVIYSVRKVPVVNILAMLTMGGLVGVFISDLILYALIVQMKAGDSLVMGVLGQSFILTSTIFVGLTSYVFITRSDFSWMGGMLWMGFIILFGALLAQYFIGSTPIIHTVFLAFGVFLFSAYILYDTSVILHHLAEDEYILGAMNLFFDFVNLFIFILQLFLSRD